MNEWWYLTDEGAATGAVVAVMWMAICVGLFGLLGDGGALIGFIFSIVCTANAIPQRWLK